LLNILDLTETDTGTAMQEKQKHIERATDPRAFARIALFNGPYQKKVLTDYTVNVSMGGLFIETNHILPVDTELLVKFKLPNIDRIISCKSRVAWVNGADSLKKENLPSGMGIQFLDLPQEDMHAVRIFIDKGELIPTW
jgi:uncharacterized protein (TIGR02266 family)